MKTHYEKVVIALSHPENLKYALLPRPYPTFLPYWFQSIPQQDADTKNLELESVQIAVPLPKAGTDLNNYGIKLSKISYIENKILIKTNNGSE